MYDITFICEQALCLFLSDFVGGFDQKVPRDNRSRKCIVPDQEYVLFVRRLEARFRILPFVGRDRIIDTRR
jgi:hypothetical protein